MAFFETASTLMLLSCALLKWMLTHQVDSLTREIEHDRKGFRDARESLRITNSRRATVRQELAQTRKQVAIRMQDVELLAKQVEREESARQAEMEEFERLKDAVGTNESFATLDSRAIFG